MAKQREFVLYEKIGRVAKITMNRPKKSNAITREMQSEIIDAMAESEKDEHVRVLVLTGTGRGFSTGEDVAELLELAKSWAAAGEKVRMPVVANPVPIYMHEHIDKPIIAAVNGVCAGMGYCMAMAADIRIGSENARFSHVYLNRGLVTSGEIWYLPRYMGPGNTLYHILTADNMDAQEALRWGILSKVVPDSELDRETMALADLVASKAPLATKFSKKAMYKGLLLGYKETMEYVGYARSVVQASGEALEGSKSFIEKREPIF